MSHQMNITRIRAVSNALGELRDQVVFVGGATVSLYADRRATNRNMVQLPLVYRSAIVVAAKQP